ncbi:hypothetical protein KP696_17105 [Nocardia seriolae]|uniref:Uncharacterized protein n=2 Tax=Nocardia seriolae TaxID=37332 RepID=A0ABC9YUM8_9NOCA|nr:hypothetical protein NS506_00227 [Nocardia seriolae]BEK84639.1 hypothetical protein NSERKGN1266_05900 [Nocardia seriolae]GAM47330.1 hypothetical protein NS07_v2contig00048-0010 [Nocardia seriolae]GAP29239.1 hypothetical protein NSK11_contig00052-0011 [Nocardia seriolae]GEM24943.1 hypothetical protein NS2_31820 [Nocardia seriolae NBRC 15557]
MSDLDTQPDPGSGVGDRFRMPRVVRAAQVLALGLAGLGIACVASSGWLLGARAAIPTVVPFVPAFVLGLIALTFNSEGQGVRIGAILVAVMNMLWTVPSITEGRPPGPLGPLVSLAVIVLLFRKEARDWFEPDAWW